VRLHTENHVPFRCISGRLVAGTFRSRPATGPPAFLKVSDGPLFVGLFARTISAARATVQGIARAFKVVGVVMAVRALELLNRHP
jgi:hypothetical protein